MNKNEVALFLNIEKLTTFTLPVEKGFIVQSIRFETSDNKNLEVTLEGVSKPTLAKGPKDAVLTEENSVSSGPNREESESN